MYMSATSKVSENLAVHRCGRRVQLGFARARAGKKSAQAMADFPEHDIGPA
jgi:hypothetical protein